MSDNRGFVDENANERIASDDEKETRREGRKDSSASSIGSQSTLSGDGRSRTGRYDLNVDDDAENSNQDDSDAEQLNGNVQSAPDNEEVQNANGDVEKVTDNSEKLAELEDNSDDSDKNLKPKSTLGVLNGVRRKDISDSDTDSLDSTRISFQEARSTDEATDENENIDSDAENQLKSDDEDKNKDTDDNHKDNQESKLDSDDLDGNIDGQRNTDKSLKERCNSIASERTDSDSGEKGGFDVNKIRKSSIASSNSDYQDTENIELKEIPNAKKTSESGAKGDSDPDQASGESDKKFSVAPVTLVKMADGNPGELRVLDENENPQEGASSSGVENNNVAPKCSDTYEAPAPDSTTDVGEGEKLEVPDKDKDVEKGKDEADAVSMYSLYMAKRDLRYYFQHPCARLFIAYLITFLNFYMFAEDPIAHSYAEATIPVLGNCFCFIVLKYPPNAWSFLKVLMWVSAIIGGCVLGKKVVHQILLQRILRLKMFAKDQGSWLIMAATTVLVLFITSWIYNLIILAGGESMEPYKIDAYLGMTNSLFARLAATGTWSGDFITAWIVTDMMLQDKLYPKWAVYPRKWWHVGYRRIIVFWAITFAAFFVVMFVIATDWINWDTLNEAFVATNEASRSFLASFILVMDLLIVMQDWDFPHFINVLDIKLPGLNTANVKFHLPKCLRKKKWEVHITGKWMNYGIIIIVMALDLNMWQTQMFYDPFKYAQYTAPDGRIYSVRDDASLSHNESLLNYDWRSNNTNPETNQTYIMGDHVTNSKKLDFGLAVTCLAFIPSGIAFIAFIFFIVYFGREKPTKEDPHAGRLAKRKKRRSRFSLKNLRRSFTRKRNRNKSSNSYSPQEAAAVSSSDA